MVLPDWAFYPLAALFGAGLIVFSLSFWPGQPQEDGPFIGAPESGFVITGEHLSLLQTGPGLTAKLVDAPKQAGEQEQGDIKKVNWRVLRVAAGRSPEDGDRSAGVFLTLPARYSTAYAGKKIALTMVLRSAQPTPAPDAYIGYYALGREDSPHKFCALSAQWQACTLRYDVPAAKDHNDIDFAGIWPDPAGLGRLAEIREIRLSLVNTALRNTTE